MKVWHVETGQTRRTPTAVSLAEYLLLFFYNLFSNKTLAATFIKTAKGHPPIRAALRGHVSLAVPLQSGSGVLHLGEVFSQILKCVCVRSLCTHTHECCLLEDLKNPDNLNRKTRIKKRKNGENSQCDRNVGSPRCNDLMTQYLWLI